MNTTHFARLAKLFIAGTDSVHEVLSNQPDGCLEWSRELESDGFWKSWDVKAFSQRRRFHRCGATLERQDQTFKQMVFELLSNQSSLTRQQLQAATGASRTCIQKIVDELKAKDELIENDRQLFLFQREQATLGWQPRIAQRRSRASLTRLITREARDMQDLRPPRNTTGRPNVGA